MKKDFAVIIGRFQPFHNGHKELIRKGLELAHNVVVVIGSAYAARSTKNPFTFVERKAMILAEFPVGVGCVAVSDYFYNDNKWFQQVKSKVQLYTGNNADIILLGHKRDVSSYYLTRFEPWKFKEVGILANDISATTVRTSLLLHGSSDAITEMCPSTTLDFLSKFIQSDAGTALVDEYLANQRYIEGWSNSPYPPIFVTADNVVYSAGHILLVKRKHTPGRGLWALPGGFVNTNETILEAAIRELREETGFNLLPNLLMAKLTDTRVFDYPERSLRGRTITHAHFYNLDGSVLPNLRAGDDAGEVAWTSLDDIYRMQDQMFEDHFSIITYFTSKF